jgi:predicted RNase H-like HicB family nuclease
MVRGGTMKEIEYTVIVHEAEEGGYWTEVPALPGAGSQGETLDEAIANTKESIELVIEVMREKGEEVPIPKDLVVKVTVAA